MARLVTLHDRFELESFFMNDPLHHLFELGDLDDAFWPHTLWFGLRQDDGRLSQVALLYTAFDPPVFMLNSREPADEARDFATKMLPYLPRRMYCHLAPDLLDIFATAYRVDDHGEHVKMRLERPLELQWEGLDDIDAPSPADEADLRRLYAEASPGTRFDSGSATLAAGHWRCLRRDGRIVSVAGVHVHSHDYGVGILANVATMPSLRREGLARTVCSALCLSLLDDGVHEIGLIVKADNTAAIKLYEGMGFTVGLSTRVCDLHAL